MPNQKQPYNSEEEETEKRSMSGRQTEDQDQVNQRSTKSDDARSQGRDEVQGRTQSAPRDGQFDQNQPRGLRSDDEGTEQNRKAV